MHPARLWNNQLVERCVGYWLSAISYPFIFEHLHLMELSDGIVVYVISFICVDFASYWATTQPLINIFWNYHIIHHSSEEFNLACALRINLIEFGALFIVQRCWVSTSSHYCVGIHLFVQFWYHPTY